MINPLVSYLKSFLGQERLQRMEDVLSNRTEYLTVVLEDLHYSQNSSAVIRHCDAFGIQSLHVIENRNRFKLKKHAMRGTLKWININFFNGPGNNSQKAVSRLKGEGYRIIATAPGSDGYSPADLDLGDGPAALFFGNEKDGLSEEILKNADATIQIPMVGFVDSLNISASCAIILQQLGDRLRKSDLPWQLEKNRCEEVRLEWLKSSLRKIDKIMEAYVPDLS